MLEAEVDMFPINTVKKIFAQHKSYYRKAAIRQSRLVCKLKIPVL